MAKKTKERSNKATPGQVREIIGSIIRVISDLNFAQAKYWVGHKGELIKELRRLLVGADQNWYVELRQDWQKFYQEQFGLACDFSKVVIPEKTPGFDRLLIIAGDLTTQQVYEKCRESFRCWEDTDESLDKAALTNDRDPKNGAYAIWLHDRVEADKELKNLSANDLSKQKVAGITLLERLIYELKYFKETGKHLDIVSWTLCHGSRDSDGRVSCVCLRGSSVFIHRYGPDFACYNVRSRAVVTC